jgi:hypothetical protein
VRCRQPRELLRRGRAALALPAIPAPGLPTAGGCSSRSTPRLSFPAPDGSLPHRERRR